jgi:phosphoglycerate dehydrogenase-like enzyme
VALAFFPGLERLLLAEPERRALAESAELLEERPLSALGEERAASLLAESEVLLSGWGCPPIDSVLLDRAPRLRLVAHAAGTVKGLVTPELFERGVRVSSAAAANALPVAEYTLAAILLANKGAFWSDHAYHRAGAAAAGVAPEVGNRGKCVGIVGASRVGRLVIERLRPFELSVLLYDPFVDEATARTLGVASVELGELLRRSDVVSLHAPLLPETTGMIGKPELAELRDGATLINTARGKVVDAAALEAELVSGRLRAVIDTSDPEPLPDDSPLRGLDNVFLTPHIAGSLGSEIGRMAELAIAEIARFARGEPLEHEVLVSDLERIA